MMFGFRRILKQSGRVCAPLVAASIVGSHIFDTTKNTYELRNAQLSSPWLASCESKDASISTDIISRPILPPSPYAPSLDEYEPVNEEMYIKDLNVSLDNHVLYSSLLHDDRIKRYDVYKHKHQQEILVVVDFGESVVGWPEIVHGGISALLIDNTFGWLLFVYQIPMSVTANLHLNYRSPVKSSSTSILKVKIDHVEGRKLHMTGSLTDARTGRVQVEAKSLFIITNRSQKSAHP